MKDFRLLTPRQAALLKRIRRKIKAYEKSFLQFFVKKKRQLLLLSPVFLLFLVLLIILSLDKTTVKKIDSIAFVPPPTKVTYESFYPSLSFVLGEQASSFTNKKVEDVDLLTRLTAKGVVVMDDESKVILFAKNSQLRFSMASTTKIMTALTALDHFLLEDILTIKETFREGAIIGLTKGEQMSFKNLLYAMLIPSGNDAAVAIAQNYPGGQQAFIKKMNENATHFHLINTRFADPTGLSDEGNYTTVVDLAMLASIALKNPILTEIVGTKHAVVANASGEKSYSLNNLNKLLGVNGVIGIKTGFTEEAGGILVTGKEEQGHRLIIVVMKSEDRFLDTSLLLSFLRGNVRYIRLE